MNTQETLSALVKALEDKINTENSRTAETIMSYALCVIARGMTR